MLNKAAPFPWGLGGGGLPALLPFPTMGAPSPGTAIPGTTVTQPGTGMGSAPGTITINGQAATIQSWTASQVVFTVPTQLTYPVTAPIVLTTASGIVDSGSNFTTTAPGPFAALFTASDSESLVNTTSTDFVMGAFDITVAAWVKVASVPAVSMSILSLWDVGNASNRPFQLFINNGGTGQARAKFQIMGTTNTIRAGISTLDLNDGAWHLVIGWWDHAAGRASIQVDNGSVVTSAANAITMTAIGPSTVPLRMGALENSGAALFFDGALDAMGFWKTAPGSGGVLDSTQRAALWNSGAGLPYSSLSASLKAALIAWWDLEEATGVARADAQGTTTMAVQTHSPTQTAGKV